MSNAPNKIFEYLRLSITDRCNLRCIYCMPPEGIPKLEHQQVLRYEEILPILHAAVEEGVYRVRLTGGEPLVRKGLPEFIRTISGISAITDLSLTTNGILLAEHAESLRNAGLRRVNISLDSLVPEKFREITRGGNLSDVLKGIEAATHHGLNPIKVNVVIISGTNDGEIPAFADLAYRHPIHVRFIERMPFAEAAQDSTFISQEIVQQTIQAKYTLVPDTRESGGGPARMFSLVGGEGKVGFISPRTQPYCQTCNRLRLTASGTLLPCLDSQEGVNVRGKTVPEIRKIIQELGQKKRNSHKPCATFESARCVSLSDIGG